MPAQPPAEAADAAHHGTAEHCQHHSYAQAGEPQPRPQQGSEFGIAQPQGGLADEPLGQGADALKAHQGDPGSQEVVEQQGPAHGFALLETNNCRHPQAQQQAYPAEGLGQPEVIEVDQQQGQQPAQQQPASQHHQPGQGPGAHRCRGRLQAGHPEPGAEQLYQRIANRDRGAAVAAAAPQP